MYPKDKSIKSCSKCLKDPLDCLVDNKDCDAELFYNSGQLAFHYFWCKGNHRVFVVYFYENHIEYCLFINGKKVNIDYETVRLGSCSYEHYVAKYPFPV